jgi:hypothetical protein
MSAKPKPAPAGESKNSDRIITGEQLDQIKRKDIANLIRKVKDGKSLSAAERKILERAAGEESSDGETVTTSRLAEIFQVNRKTIAGWRKDGREGIPAKIDGKEPLAQWRAWFAANPSAGHYDGKPRLDRETLLCEKLEVEIAIKKVEYEKEMGDLVQVGDVRESMTRVVSAARGEILKMASDLPPRMEGLSAAQMQKLIHAEIIAILSRLSDETSALYEE